MMSMKITRIIYCLVLVITLVPFAYAGGKERCQICGMDVSKYTHVKYVVGTDEGKEYVTCGVQCGLTLHLRLREKFSAATATDLISHRAIDAQEAFYVYKSNVITDMAPGFIAFSAKSNAEKFAKGFGGRVVTYDGALEIWKKMMQ
jgi:hypothetical protein